MWKMRDYIIFTDSSADLAASFAEDNGIQTVAMSYILGDDSFRCSGKETEEELKVFYDALRRGKATHTSQVSPQQYLDAFTPVLESGKDILYLSLSGGLTNSRDSVHLAILELSEKYPDSEIYAVDTLSATIGIGLLAELAVKNRENGMDAGENARSIEELKFRICHLFMVEDLMHLKRGGRIPAATAVIGTALSVKPILVIDEEGKLRIVDKKRGRKHALEDILDRYRQSRDPSSHRVLAVHSDAPDFASQLVNGVKEIDPEAEVSVNILGPVIGAHTGPGMGAIVYLGDRGLSGKNG